MLPLIGALAGSALAPTLGLGALTAGAIGSGLGSYLQTGSLERGLMTGLGSYLGGAALGKGMEALGVGGGSAAGAQGAQAAQAGADLQGAIMTPADAASASANLGATAGSGGATAQPFFSQSVPDIAPKLGMDAGSLAVGSSTAPVTFGEAAKTGLTAGTIGGALSYEPPAIDTGFGDDEEVVIPDYGPGDYPEQRLPGLGYQPGRDPEFRYFAQGGIMKLQEGGALNDKQVVDMAIKAVEGKVAEPEKALAEYMNRFGQEALLSLVNAVRSGEVQSTAGPAEGPVRGAGDGMEDLVPASLGEQDVLLSEGEFVVPADVVSGIGNGSTDAGADRLYGMLDRVREMRNGGKTQPPQIDAMEALPA